MEKFLIAVKLQGSYIWQSSGDLITEAMRLEKRHAMAQTNQNRDGAGLCS
jgi:hypothetical protein